MTEPAQAPDSCYAAVVIGRSCQPAPPMGWLIAFAHKRALLGLSFGSPAMLDIPLAGRLKFPDNHEEWRHIGMMTPSAT